MSNLVIGLSLTGAVLGWALFHYFSTTKKQHQVVADQRLKEEKYQRVLEAAKVAEREEKLFKAQTGHLGCQLYLAKEYELTNIREAINWYYRAAEQDCEIAENALARLCRLYQDDPDGEAKSRYWEQVVKARSREPEDIFELGRYQVRGFGCEVDIETGVENIIKAAEQDYITAQLFLGDWYVADVNPEKSPLLAFSWRLRSAINLDAKGCIKTAFCYQAGLGVAKDRACAIYWLERAAELGSCEAQFLAGKMHLGAGANDAAVAYTWFSIAHASGHEQAKAERDEVVEHIGIASILNVQNVGSSIFKLLKKAPVEPHKVINLLDKVYGRSAYRPSQELLDAAVSGELSQEMLAPGQQATLAADNSEGASVPLVNSQQRPVVNAKKAAAEMISVDMSPQNEESEQNNETAAREYQQQNWSASWDSFSVEMEKS